MKKTIITIPDREKLNKLIDDTGTGGFDRSRAQELVCSLGLIDHIFAQQARMHVIDLYPLFESPCPRRRVVLDRC